DPARLLQAETLREVFRHALHVDAELPAPHLALVDELLGDRARHVRGDGEAYADVAARRRKYLRVDADEVARRVDERAAGVALVDGRVRLQEVFEAAVTQARVPTLRADDAGGDGLPDAEGVADGEHDVADANLVGVAEREHGQIL